MERNKIELILYTLIGCLGLGFVAIGVVSGNDLITSIGSASSTCFPIFGVFRLFQ